MELLAGSLHVFKNLSQKERFLHLAIWLVGLIIINIRSLALTFGVFHGSDYSLLIPSLYGVVINGLIFYGTTYLITNQIQANTRGAITTALLWFSGLCILESMLDSLCYLFYSTLNVAVVVDITVGSFLMNGIFFFIPSVVYGIFTAWHHPKIEQSKIHIKDGGKDIFISFDDLLFIESNGNYLVFNCRLGKFMERKSLTKLEQELPAQFKRCHKSYIINAKLVDKKTYNEVEILGNKIPVGRKYAKIFD